MAKRNDLKIQLELLQDIEKLEKKIADFKIKLNIGEKTDYKSQKKREY